MVAVLLPFFALTAIGIYHSIQAMRNLSPDQQDASWRLLVQGTFVSSSVFTAKGLRHRNLALLFHALGLAAGFLGVLALAR